MRIITLDEFIGEMKSQGVSQSENIAFKCPSCGTIQSPQSFINAGVGANIDEVEKYVGFSCIGRWINFGPKCNWTLGGLFQIHKLEVVTPDGERHPRFELATPEEAKTLAAENKPKG